VRGGASLSAAQNGPSGERRSDDGEEKNESGRHCRCRGAVSPRPRSFGVEGLSMGGVKARHRRRKVPSWVQELSLRCVAIGSREAEPSRFLLHAKTYCRYKLSDGRAAGARKAATTTTRLRTAVRRAGQQAPGEDRDDDEEK
jgi:hypothetical protein